MKKFVDFFLEIGKIKKLKQRGLVFRKVKDPSTVAAHSFREALMGWALSKIRKPSLNTEKVLKMVLLRDLCSGYAGDIVPYESLLPKNGKPKKTIFKKWPRFLKKEKEKFFLERYKREQQALKRLTANLPTNLKKEMRNLWQEYADGLSKESRFVQQLNVLEKLIQGLEYWQEDKKFPIEPWWHQMKEIATDPILLEILKQLDKKFHQSS